jgi:hypothetical protein
MKSYLKGTNALRLGIFAVAVALVLLGIFGGELREIHQKGSMVCLECIGIG